MTIPDERPFVELSLVSFKSLKSEGAALAFFQTLESFDGIYVPQEIENEDGTVPYKRKPEFWKRIWRGHSFALRRNEPTQVVGVVELDMSLGRLSKGAYLFWMVEAKYFQRRESLTEMVKMGDALYDVLSPCYVYLTLPWGPEIGATASPYKGLPGMGWVTWLGPEYDDLVRFPPNRSVIVEKLQDGGRRIICGTRSRWSPAGYGHLMKWINPQVFQRKLPSIRVVKGEEEAEREFQKILVETALAKATRGNESGPKLPNFRYTQGLKVDEESNRGAGD